MARHKTKTTAFTRHRSLPFSCVVGFLMNMVKGAVPVELTQFFDAMPGGTGHDTVTGSAFSQARRFLKASAFIELNHFVISLFLKTHQKRWQGFRLLAVDGTTINLPNEHTLKDWYGHAQHKAQARGSQLYDVLNRLTLHAAIVPLKKGERALAMDHLKHTQQGDLVIYDRGYPAFYLFAEHARRGVDFCARAFGNFHPDIARFIDSGQQQQLLTLHPNAAALRQCRKRKLSTLPLTIRMLRVELKTGEIEVLLTSVRDDDIIPCSAFQALYHKRWGIEEDYKLMKSRLVVEQFSGKTVHAIQQDFFAKILSKNLVVMFAEAAQVVVDEKPEVTKWHYKINLTTAVSLLKNSLVRLLFKPGRVKKKLHGLIERIAGHTNAVRPDRSFKRTVRQGRKHHLAYKQTA